jgi:hypothetical protein
MARADFNASHNTADLRTTYIHPKTSDKKANKSTENLKDKRLVEETRGRNHPKIYQFLTTADCQKTSYAEDQQAAGDHSKVH